MMNLGICSDDFVIALLDADILVYKACCVGDYEQMEFHEVQRLALNILDEWTKFSNGFHLVFSSPDNFRKRVYPDYKAHRADKPKPCFLNELREWLSEDQGSMTCDGYEADDVIGSCLADLEHEGQIYLAVSTDKDLRQIPGWHWNPDKERWPWFVIQKAADYFLKYQILVGDSSDGYGGAPGIGPKKALKILSSDPSLEDLQQYFPSPEDFTKTVRLATILRTPDLPEWASSPN